MGKLNLLATSSSSGFLKCLRAPEGHVIVGADVASLEPHVLAHFSQDPGYMQIYGKGVAPNCIYLYLGAHSEEHGHLFRSVYDPLNSTAESVEEAKKLFADERQRYKVCVLALAYEGTEYALDRMFKKYKTYVPWSRLSGLVQLFKRTFYELPKFKSQLLAEWEQRGGYILTGRGRPLGVPRDKVDDIIAYFCQSTGHDYMLRIKYYINQYRKQHNAPFKPYMPDFHDALYLKCLDNKADIEETKAAIAYGFKKFNEDFDLTVELKGSPKVGKDMRIK